MSDESTEIETDVWGCSIPNFCPFCGDDIERDGSGYRCIGQCEEMFWLD